MIENVGSKTNLERIHTYAVEDKENACNWKFEYHRLKKHICEIVIIICGYSKTVFCRGINEQQGDNYWHNWITVESLREVNWWVRYPKHQAHKQDQSNITNQIKQSSFNQWSEVHWVIDVSDDLFI